MKKLLICIFVVLAVCAVKDVVSMEARRRDSHFAGQAVPAPKKVKFFITDRNISCKPYIEVNIERYNPNLNIIETVGITLDNPRGIERNYKIVEFYKGPLSEQFVSQKDQKRAWRVSRMIYDALSHSTLSYDSPVKQGYIRKIEIKDACGVTHTIDSETIDWLNKVIDENRYEILDLEVIRNEDPMSYGKYAYYIIKIIDPHEGGM